MPTCLYTASVDKSNQSVTGTAVVTAGQSLTVSDQALLVVYSTVAGGIFFDEFGKFNVSAPLLLVVN